MLASRWLGIARLSTLFVWCARERLYHPSFVDSYFGHIKLGVTHLFFSCPFSQACWIFLDIAWDLNLPTLNMVIQARERFGSVIFREIVMVAAWSIWCHRNSIVFDRASFMEEIKLVTLRAKPAIKEKIKIWLSSLL
ncbi:hypothetical protein SETIT_4G155300v2 [Setaria italica]|uniref:Reverse transcriptase zinc-binding domain-containing protein n=1 Tax=Setaria italica TaxID=4555 RepID=A0A368QWJ6_SETIT|nr:hypothetical protein SETIT_4G155300v2 [Setaria italica]